MARHSKKIDNLFWQGGSGFGTALSAGQAAVNFAASAARPSTVLRIRGELTVYVDGASAPGKLIQVSWGIIKVPTGSGTTVQYAPVADAAAPWMAYGRTILGYEEMVTDVIDVAGLTLKRFDVDSKAMRRMRPDEELQFVIENTTIGTASAINWAYGVRVLQGD